MIINLYEILENSRLANIYNRFGIAKFIKVIWCLLLSGIVTGLVSSCTSLGIGQEEYSCSGLPNGVRCLSARDVYINRHNFEQTRISTYDKNPNMSGDIRDKDNLNDIDTNNNNNENTDNEDNKNAETFDIADVFDVEYVAEKNVILEPNKVAINSGYSLKDSLQYILYKNISKPKNSYISYANVYQNPLYYSSSRLPPVVITHKYPAIQDRNSGIIFHGKINQLYMDITDETIEFYLNNRTELTRELQYRVGNSPYKISNRYLKNLAELLFLKSLNLVKEEISIRKQLSGKYSK